MSKTTLRLKTSWAQARGSDSFAGADGILDHERASRHFDRRSGSAGAVRMTRARSWPTITQTASRLPRQLGAAQWHCQAERVSACGITDNSIA